MTSKNAFARPLSAALLLLTITCAACNPPDPSTNGSDASQDMSDDMSPPSDMNPSPEDMPEDQDDSIPSLDMDMDTPDIVIIPDDMDDDMDMDEDDMTDMMIPSGDYPKPAQVTAGDASKILLRGTILTANGALNEGEVLVSGDTIACVDADCSSHPDAAGATTIETHGIISPGLIDSHNHLAYNFLPEWVPPAGETFTNRYQWADHPSYEEHIAPYANNRSSNSHFCPAARWGELRSLLHGTTTIQGQSFARTCTRGGVRNADQHHELDYYDHMRTSIGSVRDITDSDADGYIEGFRAATEPDTRFAVHMAEGYADDNITEEFASFAGRDMRNNRHTGISLLEDETAILIHSIALTDSELQEAKMHNARIVWSPSSNMVLYGQTADINRILELGITTGLGPDWTLSGEDDMLGELRYARDWALQNAAMRVTPLKLWEMATMDGAKTVGLDAFIGELIPGQVADITVFRRRNPTQDPYEQAITSRAEDVRLVMIGGEVWNGDANLKDALARESNCDSFDACGVEKFVCVPYTSGDDFQQLSDIEGALVDIMEGTGFPADEQYGRGDELLPLVTCD